MTLMNITKQASRTISGSPPQNDTLVLTDKR